MHICLKAIFILKDAVYINLLFFLTITKNKTFYFLVTCMSTAFTPILTHTFDTSLLWTGEPKLTALSGFCSNMPKRVASKLLKGSIHPMAKVGSSGTSTASQGEQLKVAYFFFQITVGLTRPLSYLDHSSGILLVVYKVPEITDNK